MYHMACVTKKGRVNERAREDHVNQNWCQKREKERETNKKRVFVLWFLSPNKFARSNQRRTVRRVGGHITTVDFWQSRCTQTPHNLLSSLCYDRYVPYKCMCLFVNPWWTTSRSSRRAWKRDILIVRLLCLIPIGSSRVFIYNFKMIHKTMYFCVRTVLSYHTVMMIRK